MHKGPPPIRAGDWISPSPSRYNYSGAQHRWPSGEWRKVHAVEIDENGYYVLVVWNPVKGDFSRYTPYNFVEQENRKMAGYERTKYIGARATEDGDIAYGGDREYTQWRNSQHEVRVDIAKVIGAGDKWLVLQTVCLIEGEEPRPPIRVTEYR
jgi:hypothetical protein